MWHSDYSQHLNIPPIAAIEAEFGLTGFVDWPNADELNHMANNRRITNGPMFESQAKVVTDLYYEQYIAEKGIVPTRENNWHDLFNGLIWLQFPHTKQLLNQLHISEIDRFGLTPRTPKRDRITHFDECGMVLAYSNSDILELLLQHRWQQAFLDNQKWWGRQVDSFVFGHAILEMLLNPFIGLTGKWLAVEVNADFFELSQQQKLTYLDEALCRRITDQDIFSQPKPAKPLPVLGIPGWYHGKQDKAFYANQGYFQPKRVGKVAKLTK